jgi:hypothetical protein
MIKQKEFIDEKSLNKWLSNEIVLRIEKIGNKLIVTYDELE